MVQNQEKTIVASIIAKIPRRSSTMVCAGLFGSAGSYLVSRFHRELAVPVVVVAPSGKEAERIMEDLRFFLEDQAACLHHFPAHGPSPFKSVSHHGETAARRIRTLYQLVAGSGTPVVVTSIDALMHRLVPRQEIGHCAELLVEGEEADRDLLVGKMISGGYVRSAIVEEPGDFAVRGGIMDIFSPLYDEPVRIEWFGDTIESLRVFSAQTQRTMGPMAEAVILPARETILKRENLEEIIFRVRKQASLQEIPVTRVRELVERIKKEGIFPGIEGLTPLIYPKLDTFFDYASQDTLFILVEPSELTRAAERFQEQAERNHAAARNEGRLCVEPSSLYLLPGEVEKALDQKRPILFPVFAPETPAPEELRFSMTVEDNGNLQLELTGSHRREGLLQPLAAWIRQKKEVGFRSILVCSTASQARRLKSLLSPYGFEPETLDGFSSALLRRDPVAISMGSISTGFVWPAESLALVTEDEIFGAKHHARKKRDRPKIHTELFSYEELKKGDLVVHTEHGIGQYDGLMKLRIERATNDFLFISYRDGDKLYLPVDHMNMVQKYIGVDGITPVLDKMGGKSWDRVKSKVKRSVEKIAGELLALYATRKVQEGHCFGQMDGYFRDFEAAFPYDETEDQLKAIEDVIQDMQHANPMDRLVCGDVGYGKTEVALRASFLAINEGKQVAILVPTTVLAEQHYATFTARFERYPVEVACLSRFRSTRDQKKIIEGLKNGKIDVVIGTHRLLQNDVAFKDLGLLIVDEEQRFGVKHKERLKKLRATVDVLALTATPIPRTLHLSLMGVRDISVISTPPEHRRPIITYVCELDDGVISEAIRKELQRKGQIFFVHNNIHGIHAMATRIRELVPEVRLDIAHGQMQEDDLEKVMLRFYHRDIDMIVTTTIIESGLDVPSANTILINRADRFGLAQIYQLRGRVGRSDEQAYAYLFIPPDSALGKDAQKRLKVLMEHSDLGSGFQIAMSDLQIRGGGTVLGASQSGHIAAVGYDMFLRLMENAVSEMKGEPTAEPLHPEINVEMSAFLPESYIADIDQRMSAYRRLAKMSAINEISAFKEELADRYGDPPPEATSLLFKIMLKVLCEKAGVKRLDLNGQQLALHLSETHMKNPWGIVDLVASGDGRHVFTPDQIFKTRLTGASPVALLAQTKNILKEISQRVNG